MEKIYSRFTKSKKEVTVQDLQKEIKDSKAEMRNLKQELTILRVDHGLMDLRVKNLEFTSQQGNEDRISLQNPSDIEVDETVNPTAEMEPEPSKNGDVHINASPALPALRAMTDNPSHRDPTGTYQSHRELQH